jgi:acetylornithine deacetylase
VTALGLRAANLLAPMVEIRTHHPSPGDPGGDERALCDHLVPLLAARGADEIVVADVGRAHGGPGAYVWARWGTPTWILNVHVDTVPANRGWTRDPWTATIDGDRLWGLGSADTKGAIACALAAMEVAQPTDLAVLFSGDEERGTAAMHAFLAGGRTAGITTALVAEPTSRQAAVRHRGVLAYTATVRGIGGHSSKADRMPRPIAALARLAVALDELAKVEVDRGPDGLHGLCVNVAGLDGGVAFNVVPEMATLTFSIRPYPGFDRAAWNARLAALVADAERAGGMAIALDLVTDHAPFAARDPARLEAWLAGPPAVTVDFWTEAALWAEAGIDAIVCGPGDIGHAHAADEHVTLADLSWATALYARLFAKGAP